MRNPRRFSPFAALVMLALASSCGNNNVTNPPPGGGATKELDSGNIPTGGVFSHTFANVGTFNYSCTIHGSGMAGQVIVLGGSLTDSVLVTIADNNYTPTPATVKPGGSVRWINSGSTHTVTSP